MPTDPVSLPAFPGPAPRPARQTLARPAGACLRLALRLPLRPALSSALSGAASAVTLALLLGPGPCAAPATAQNTTPMSAIDWLSDSVRTPSTPPAAAPGADAAAPGTEATAASHGTVPAITEPAVTPTVTLDAIAVAPLDEGTRPDAIGVRPATASGLPVTLWGASRAADLARRIRAEQPEMLPALQALLYRVMLAELAPPADSGPGGESVFLARVDKLLEMGALDQAEALLSRAGTPSPEIFRRAFDTSLLLGQEEKSCEILLGTPTLAPTYQARVFCLARAGDWNEAALLLGNGSALGVIPETEADLLARFLDPDLFEDQTPPRPPLTPTPLTFRLFEAIGEAIPTTGMPLAFAQTDLRPNIGWKARIVAGERLARTGAVSDNQLLGLYTERRAAASGGVWERVKALQALEAAMENGDQTRIANALLPLWEALTEARVESQIAHIHGPKLASLQLPGKAGQVAFHMGLLSDDYETVARAARPATPLDTLLVGLAQGNPAALPIPDARARAVVEGFAATEPPVRLSSLLATDRLGEAILRAMTLFAEGTAGDFDQVTDAIALFRSVGLEDTARRAALEFLILDRQE